MMCEDRDAEPNVSACETESEAESTAASCNSPFPALQTASDVFSYLPALYLTPCLCVCPASPLFFSWSPSHTLFSSLQPHFSLLVISPLSRCLCFISLSACQTVHTQTQTRRAHTQGWEMQQYTADCQPVSLMVQHRSSDFSQFPCELKHNRLALLPACLGAPHRCLNYWPTYLSFLACIHTRENLLRKNPISPISLVEDYVHQSTLQFRCLYFRVQRLRF